MIARSIQENKPKRLRVNCWKGLNKFGAEMSLTIVDTHEALSLHNLTWPLWRPLLTLGVLCLGRVELEVGTSETETLLNNFLPIIFQELYPSLKARIVCVPRYDRYTHVGCQLQEVLGCCRGATKVLTVIKMFSD